MRMIHVLFSAVGAGLRMAASTLGKANEVEIC